MKISSTFFLLLAAASTEMGAAQTALEIFNAISACCDSGCQDACDWKVSQVINPSAGVGTDGRRPRGNAVTRKLGVIEDNCCVGNGGSGGDPHFKVSRDMILPFCCRATRDVSSPAAFHRVIKDLEWGIL